MSLAPPSELAGVKVYNLSSVGKALPAWVTERRKNASVNSKKRRGRVQDERIEIIQDLFFPTTSGRVKISRDGSTMMATGGYPPMVRAYELRELSLKFTRNFESDVVQFQMLSPDWKKAVFLLADRSIEFHSQFGKHHVTRIPHHGRAMAYQRETCDLLLGGVGGELYRLNLERGSFLAPLQTGASGLNVLAVNPTHGMLMVGTQDGHVQCWDPRQRLPLGTCSPFDAPEIARAAAATHGLIDPGAPEGERELLPAPREVTALRFDARGLQLAVGTSTGHVALYDLRRASPLRIKDHQYGLPIVDIKYHSMTGHVVSSDAKSIKIWERESGKTYTSIEPAADVNDVALYPDSGMIFAALETERLGAYFVPSLGPAPRWCHFLDNITEEMEEAPTSQGLYDDYKFVTREEIEKLGLAALLGTTTLRPYMHGFFVDAKLHAKAVSLSQPFAYEQWRKQRLEEKLAAKTAGRIAPVLKPKVKVNAELAEDLRAPAKKRSFGSKGDESEVPKGALLDDSRFASLFTNPDFAISRDSEEYQALHPHAKELNDARASRLKAARAEERKRKGMFATTEHTPVLKENVRVPANRFDPETYDQYLTSVYVLWNLLDRIILRHRPDRGMPQMPYGYMRLVQLHSYSRLVWKRDDVRTYCETGVNGGHGTAAMLLANPHLVTHSFDLGIQPYSRDVFDLLKLYFGERFNLYVGDSHRTLPQFAANESNHRQCDVILIDGDHGDGAYDDIRDFKPLAACHAHVLLDDTLPTAAGVNAGPRNAIRQAVAQGMIKVVRNHGYNVTTRDNPCLRDKFGGRPHCFNPWGWAIARYLDRSCKAESSEQAALRASLERRQPERRDRVV